MPRVSMIEASIKDVTKAFTKYAQKDKSFAERLVFNNGLRGHITNNALNYNLGLDIFDKSGNLTSDGADAILDIIHNNKLNSNSTWYDAIKTSHAKWLKSKNPAKNNYTVFDYMVNPYTII